MTRNLARIALAAALAAGLAFGSGTEGHAQGTPDIGFARAEQIALTAVKNGTVKEMKRGAKKGRATYSVEVDTGDKAEWDVLIDASDGTVISVKQDD